MRIEVRTAGTASAHLGYAPDVGDWVLGQPPTYGDFTYMAFMVGMAYAMAETEPETPTSARSFSATRCCPTPSARASSPWPSTL